MTIENDYGNIYFYRLFLLTLYTGYTTTLFCAPFYQQAMTLVVALLMFNLANMTVQASRMIHATMRILRAVTKPVITGRERYLVRRHVFIVPNYKEPIAVLQNTLRILAEHQCAHTYTIVLAMEQKEPGYDEKANTLIREFNNNFDKITYTGHVLAEGEMPGKASNVNSAVRTIDINLAEDDMLTVLDADAEVPEKYVHELDAIANNKDIFCAPILFDQNTKVTPFIVCVNDYMWASMGIQNMCPWLCRTGFPMSAYSLSAGLVRVVGFWDTHPDAIGEDMHMFIKTYVKTRGETGVRMVPVPINMGHVEGGCWARVLQAERHMRGIADTAYVVRNAFRACSPFKAIGLLLQTLEAHLLPIATIQTMLILPALLNTTGQGNTFETAAIDKISKGVIVMAVIVLGCYEIIRHFSCRHLFNRAPLFKPWYIPGYLLLLVAAAPYSVFPFLFVAVNHLLNRTSSVYWVAPKSAVTTLQNQISAIV